MDNENLATEIEQTLLHFTGSEMFYRHAIGNFVYTEGIQYLAEKAQCYWLLDVIGSYQTGKIKAVPFQLWELTVNVQNQGVVAMKEDTDEPELVKQNIPFTDFPLKSVQLYFIDGTLLLPSEY
ncbi:MAG: hypothetical protein H6696_05510 [Deferribacteres bacterium]|nr:hypothetical protein [candidate division KSB1 bacterium]MCB9501375.1 hypothetical protein [Deferribacteres bacterium]